MSISGSYKKLILDQPWKVLVLIIILTAVAGYFLKDFRLDASSESLILENDKSLKYYRKIKQQYGTDEFLIITYTPFGDLLSEDSLHGLKYLRDKILLLDSVQSVVSILDVPVIYNSGLQLSELETKLDTLESSRISSDVARKEFQTNPFYKNRLVSEDGKTTAMQVIFYPDEKYYELINRRNYLNELADNRKLAKGESRELENITKLLKLHNEKTLEQRERDIQRIRKLMSNQQHHAKLYLGGIPMITVDMIRFIRHDLIVFGTGVLVFLLLILLFFFRKPRWMLLPFLCCGITGLLMIGFLGFMDWSVTVISSNFLSILLIITLSLTIHLIVRFRDLHDDSPDKSHKDLVKDTVISMARPCFYTILTTIVAFASLIVSGIRPVIDFGWIMVIGLGISFVISFLVFPSILSLLPEIPVSATKNYTKIIMLRIADFVKSAPGKIIYLFLSIMLIIGTGIVFLEVENRFIDNFKSSTEIYQGMKIIDQKLGGTTPLDIIIDPDKDFYELKKELAIEENEFNSLFQATDIQQETSYWLNQTMMNKVQKIHNHLQSYPTIGKVLSIGTALKVVEKLNNAPLDDFELALIRKRVPEKIAEDLITPYLSEDANQVRFSARAIETDPALNRKQLLSSIREFLVNEMRFEESQVHLTGMLVLYNNMLQSLYRSQILTIGAVFAAIFLTFLILFRSLILATLAIIPNLFSAFLVLGIMGWLGIPLDMMTITIAAITIGISVDDTIHYIHRLQNEYTIDHDYPAAIKRCHSGVGKAMYHTSIAIIFGFAILTLSNFIPTIYFGILTGLAMIAALAGDLVLLPAIVLITKPDAINTTN